MILVEQLSELFVVLQGAAAGMQTSGSFLLSEQSMYRCATKPKTCNFALYHRETGTVLDAWPCSSIT